MNLFDGIGDDNDFFSGEFEEDSLAELIANDFDKFAEAEWKNAHAWAEDKK